MDSHEISTVPVVTHPKRLQVPKACSNCRKMHAGCDMERPCRRCVQNGLESSCMDVPRKKRVSKKRPKTEEEGQEGVRILEVSNLKNEDAVNRYWDDTYNELFGGYIPSISTPPMPTAAIESFNPYGYEPEPLILTEMNEEPSPVTPSFGAVSATSMADFSPQQLSAYSPPTPPQNGGGLSNDSLQYLVQQIKELHESNKSLESKLIGVTNELVDLKRSSGPQNNEKALAALGGWHSFSPQTELAISVWKATAPEGSCPRNVLVEANSKFVQLLGYSMDVLRNNFVCTNMVRKQDICPDARDNKNGREWPKRTQIITAYGLKDVFITITPVQEQKNAPPKFFLVYILEITS